MRKIAIICEYNPLHNGHAKHIKFSKQSEEDILICIMSGDVVQRGQLPIFDKYTRARHAILAGADIVIELPTIFACSSANNFAYGAVKIASQLNCDVLSFGSECGDIKLLKEYADLLDSPLVNLEIRKLLSTGENYPTAVSKATKKFCDINLIDEPNNLLAIEYIKTAKLLNFQPHFLTLKRDNDYNGTIVNEVCSASAIRNAIANGDFESIKSSMPSYVYDDIILNSLVNINANYSIFAHAYINCVSAEFLSNIDGMTEGIENRIIDCRGRENLASTINSLKTKRYTHLKILRLILNSILNITKSDMINSKSIELPTTVLAINKSRCDSILSELQGSIKSLDATKLNEIQTKQLELSKTAHRLYCSMSNKQYDINLNTMLNKIASIID